MENLGKLEVLLAKTQDAGDVAVGDDGEFKIRIGDQADFGGVGGDGGDEAQKKIVLNERKVDLDAVAATLIDDGKAGNAGDLDREEGVAFELGDLEGTFEALVFLVEFLGAFGEDGQFVVLTLEVFDEAVLVGNEADEFGLNSEGAS